MITALSVDREGLFSMFSPFALIWPLQLFPRASAPSTSYLCASSFPTGQQFLAKPSQCFLLTSFVVGNFMCQCHAPDGSVCCIPLELEPAPVSEETCFIVET
ncbi:hypothetical protein Droror1_Dr00018510 [Drosera rotundifolia]